MAISTMRVPTIFTAVDRFSGVVTRMTSSVSAFGRTAEASAMRASRRFNSVGTSLLTTGATMAVGIGYAVNEAMKYEQAIASLAAVTGTSVGAMNGQIESLHKETKRNAIDIAKSFEIVGSKMSQYLDNPEALKMITKSSILMADAARMELQPAIESLTGVLNIFGKSASDANYIVNKLSAGEIVGSVSIAETSDILRQFGATARLANVQVDESVALIQTLTKSLGVEGVGRGIRNLMVDLNMVGSFDKNKMAALSKVGVNMDILGNKSLDLVTRLRELKKLEGNSAAMGLFFKRTGIQTGATLFQNFDDYIRFLEAIKKTNAAQEQADKNNATMAKRFKDLKAEVSFLAVKIGEGLLPKIEQMTNSAIATVRVITDWIKRNQWLASTILSLTIILLKLGVIAKVAGVLFYGLGRIIAFVTFISETYAAVTSLVAAAQLAQALSGASLTTVLWGLVASLWAAYWPVLLIVGALGLLAYEMFKTSDSTEDMTKSVKNSLNSQNEAYMNSTKVVKVELKKQQDMLNGFNDRLLKQQTIKSVQGSLLNSGALSKGLYSMNPNSANFDVTKYLQLKNSLNEAQSSYFQSKVLPNFAKKDINMPVLDERPKNLGGSENLDISRMLRGRENRGELVINIKDTGHHVSSTEQKGNSINGIPVVLKKNQGSFSNN